MMERILGAAVAGEGAATLGVGRGGDWRRQRRRNRRLWQRRSRSRRSRYEVLLEEEKEQALEK